MANQILPALPVDDRTRIASLAGARARPAAVRNFAVGDPEESPRALQTSECRELLNPTRTSCLILAPRQPGKLPAYSAEANSSLQFYY